MNQNKGRIALFMTLALVSAILVPIASGIETEINEGTQTAESSLPALLSEQRGDRNRTNNFTDETGFLNGTYPWSDLPPDYRFDEQFEENIPYALLDSTGSWTLINASPGWSARSEHSVIVMPVDGSIVLMGGAGQGLFNDVWRSFDNGVTWTRVVSQAPWSARSHFTAVAMPDNSIVLMGGRDGSGYRNDVWRSTDNGTSWTQMTASAGWSARMCPTSVALSDNSIILMGGAGNSGSKNDTWMSEDYGATWSLRSSSSGWGARYVHSSVALADDNILLLGGYNFGYTWYNDTWLSADKGATWTLQTMNAEWPARFTPVSTVMPDGSVMLMGGYGGYLMNDLWQSTDNGTTWSLINQTSGWSVRYSHRAVTTHDGNVVLMGGVDYSVPYRDVWRYVPAPVANFSATPTSGPAPLTVQFTDISINSPTSWSWSFGDGNTSTMQDPSHIYTSTGTYNVSLTAENAGGSDTEEKAGYIEVMEPEQTDFYVYAEGIGMYHGTQDDLTMGNSTPGDFYNLITGQCGTVDNGKCWNDGGIYIDDNAGSLHWNSSEQASSFSDNADFSIFVGHGWNNGIAFGTPNSVLELERQQMSFGGSKAKWVSLFACDVLNQSTGANWESVFKGVHIINGFDTHGLLYPQQGTKYAQMLTGNGGGYDRTSVRDAWRRMLKETINNGGIKGAYMWAYPCGNDYLPGFGDYCAFPIKDEQDEYDITWMNFDCQDV